MTATSAATAYSNKAAFNRDAPDGSQQLRVVHVAPPAVVSALRR